MKRTREYGVTHLYLSGMLTTASSVELKNELDRVVANNESHVVLNMKDLQLITSAGLRVLLACAKALARSKGKVILCEMSDAVFEIFRMTGFDGIFTICPSTEEISESLAA